MPKPRYKTTNWHKYNSSLVNRGSLTFWIDEEAITEWKQTKQDRRGRPRLFSDLAITTALMVKRIFSLPLTGLKVYGEGEWKVKKHGTDGKRRVWRKLHLAVDTDTHEIIAAELTLSGVTDAEVLPNLLKQTSRAIKEISGDGAYDTRECHRAIRVKKAIPLIPPREGAAFWEKGHPRNLAVGCQKLYGSNKKWKQKYGYHRRSLSETAMYRVKQLLGASLTLRNYNAQVGETYAMIKALNKLTGIGMPETQYIV